MTVDDWMDADTEDLQQKYDLISPVFTHPTTTWYNITDTTIDATAVKDDKLYITYFLKYINDNLSSLSGIMLFYDNLQTQCFCHNIFVRPSSQINNNNNTVVTDGMD